MGKFVRTNKGFINSEFIIRVEIPDGKQAFVYFSSPTGADTAEVKGDDDVREMKNILNLPVPKEDGYTGDSMPEYPELRKGRKP